MILSFKPQFVEPILNGTKIHTIRLDPHDRWRPGMKIHFATGIRTKNYNCFKMGICKSIQKIRIDYDFPGDPTGPATITINNKIIQGPLFLETLAKNDGFNYVYYFLQWFNADFTGKLIHWTDYRY